MYICLCMCMFILIKRSKKWKWKLAVWLLEYEYKRIRWNLSIIFLHEYLFDLYSRILSRIFALDLSLRVPFSVSHIIESRQFTKFYFAWKWYRFNWEKQKTTTKMDRTKQANQIVLYIVLLAIYPSNQRASQPIKAARATLLLNVLCAPMYVGIGIFLRLRLWMHKYLLIFLLFRRHIYARIYFLTHYFAMDKERVKERDSKAKQSKQTNRKIRFKPFSENSNCDRLVLFFFHA